MSSRPVHAPRRTERRPFRSGTVRRRLALLAGLVLTVVLVGTTALLMTQRDLADITAARTSLGRGVLHIDDLLGSYVDQETALRGYLLSADPSFLTPKTAADAALPDQTALVRADAQLPGAPAGAVAAVAAIEDLHAQWVSEVVDPEIAAAAAGRLDAARAAEAGGTGLRLFDRIRDEAATIHAGMGAARDRYAARQAGLERRLEVISGASGVALLLVLVAVGVAAERNIVRPLAVIGARARSVVAGRRDRPLDQVRGPAELRAVAGDLEAMRTELLLQLSEQRRLVEALDQDGPAVLAVRAALDTTVTDRDRLLLTGRLESAEGVLAGDWFDVFDLPGGRTVVVVGDVTGHGARAGVFALRLKHVLRTAMQLELDPDRALAVAAAALGAAPDDADVAAGALFATAVIAVLDPAHGTLRYASAGHPDALLWTSDHAAPERLGSTGPLITGLTAGHRWSSRTLEFPHGSTAGFLTDGLIEARPAGSDDEFGEDRLIDLLASHLTARANSTDVRAALDQAADAALAAARAHAGALRDDCTMLLVHHVATTARRRFPATTSDVRLGTAPEPAPDRAQVRAAGV